MSRLIIYNGMLIILALITSLLGKNITNICLIAIWLNIYDMNIKLHKMSKHTIQLNYKKLEWENYDDN